MEHPMMRAWRTLVRYPTLALVPLGWEAVTVGCASLLGLVSHPGAPRVRFRWPNTLPGGADLLGTSLLHAGWSTPAGQWVLFGATFLLDTVVTAGFLRLIAAALGDQAPSWYGFVEGMTRFGMRLVQWRLLWMMGAFLISYALSHLAALPMFLMMWVALYAMLVCYLVEFLVPVRDMTLREALVTSPTILNRHLGGLLLTGATCLLLSGALSYALSANHLQTLLVASPLWCFFGTWMTASICAAVADPSA